ncbi:MAG TPA: aminoacyl-tRNA hydrolase [Phycisphaerae bacterium]|nr:aminoacyl-tRNA hydrolase [Phycisphaerae bacterium]
MKLVVGLGNPGSEYARTRHNVGYRVVDELARRWEFSGARRQFSGLAVSGQAGQEKVLLLKPTTYMNRSGQSVREAMTFHKIDLPDVMVVLDDMALPLGRIRLRAEGSAGGHNGLSDVIGQLGSDLVGRLRIGIEQVSGERMVSHVLTPFSPREEEVIATAVTRAADAVECWLKNGMDEAMTLFNRAEEQGGRA